MNGPEDLVMQLYGLGGYEWIIVIIILVLVFFGVKKYRSLPDLLVKHLQSLRKLDFWQKEIQQLKK
jgi:Sec-independent protein translocase protein TatA